MFNLNKFGIVGCSVSVLTLILAIVACSVNTWLTTDTVRGKSESGLWQICIDGSPCSVIDDLFSKLEGSNKDLQTQYRAVRAMIILAILLCVAAIACGVVVMFVLKQHKVLYFVAGGLSVAAGLFLMVAFGIFADKIKGPSNKYGSGFALDIVAWIFSWVAGGMFIVAKIKDKGTVNNEK